MMKQCQLMLFIIIFVTTQVALAAQPNKTQVREALTKKINQHRSGRIDEEILAEAEEVIFAANPHTVLEALIPFHQDASPKVRREAIYIAWEIARRTPPPSKIRQEVVERLLEAYSDIEISFNAYGLLLSFRAEDFTEWAKSRLRQLLVPEYPHANRETIMLIGVANMRDQIPMLETIRATFPDYASLPPDEKQFLYGTAGWKARLALARMGEQEDLEYCIKMVESWPDVKTRVITLLKDLAYTRQPRAIRVIQKYLESDDIIPPKGDVLGSPYWRYAIDILAKILEDFPVTPHHTYSREDVEIARIWMLTQFTDDKIKR